MTADLLGWLVSSPTAQRQCRYITVHEAKQRRLFYVLVESEEDPDTAPLVLWLNGCARTASRETAGKEVASRDAQLEVSR